MTTFVFTFACATAIYGGLFGLAGWFACRRIGRHIKDNPQGRDAVMDHVVTPLFWGRGEPASASKAAGKIDPASEIHLESWRGDGVTTRDS